MLAINEDRHQEGVVGRMGVAAIGIVVEIGVAFADVARVIAGHILPLQMGAEDVDRQSFGRGEKLIVAGEDAAREVARARDDRRTGRAQQRVGHFAHDAVEPVGNDRHHHGVEHSRARLGRRLGSEFGRETSFGLDVSLGFGLAFVLDWRLAFCLAIGLLAYDFKM